MRSIPNPAPNDSPKIRLTKARARLCQYIIWHRRHTEPILASGSKQAKFLLDIDQKALVELSLRLLRAQEAANCRGEFEGVLDSLISNIKGDQWHDQITYLRAFYAWGEDLSNDAAAQRELKQIEPIDRVNDVQILQFYLDVNKSRLSSTQSLKLIDRIINLAENGEQRLHYRAAKASVLLAVTETKSAVEELETAINEYRAIRNLAAETDYGKWIWARSLNFLGLLGERDDLFNEAVEVFTEQTTSPTLTPAGRAEMYRDLGDAYRGLEKWSAAQASYQAALTHCPKEIYKVLTAEAVLKLSGANESLHILDTVVAGLLSAPEQADHAFATAEAVLAGRLCDKIESTLELLQSLEIREPFFRERRDDLRIHLLELKSGGYIPVNDTKTSKRRRFAMALVALSRYTELKPNIMGIGINVNNILDDLANRIDGTNEK